MKKPGKSSICKLLSIALAASTVICGCWRNTELNALYGLWAQYVMEAKELFGKDAEVIMQSHNWPHWGNNVINEYMTRVR